jgi:hypothetical protein
MVESLQSGLSPTAAAARPLHMARVAATTRLPSGTTRASAARLRLTRPAAAEEFPMCAALAHAARASSQCARVDASLDYREIESEYFQIR